MSLANRGIHGIIHKVSDSSKKQFRKALANPVKAQEKVLKEILHFQKNNPFLKGVNNREDLKSLPLSDYKSYAPHIEEAKKGKKNFFKKRCQHFEPTSGSTDNLKWIPYNSLFKNQLDRAAGAWMADLYEKYPGIKRGRHYWSLSWLPDDLKSQMSSDDINALPWWKKQLLKEIMVVDQELLSLPTSELCQLESLVRLGARDVSLISVWSPTMLLKMLHQMFENKEALIKEYEAREYKKSASLLKIHKSLNPEFCQLFFPELELISSWDSSTSCMWAGEIQRLFPHVAFQGKGLWATEGVVTIPFENTYPLAVTSHYYEFWDRDLEKFLDLTDLKEGMVVNPLLTTGSGFCRYLMDDDLLVTGKLYETPTFKFIGRQKNIDLAGEKTSFERASHILQNFSQTEGARPVSIIAHNTKKGRFYELLFEGQKVPEGTASRFEEQLKESFHYRLARDLGQLEPSRVSARKDALNYYYQTCEDQVPVIGNIKPEPLVLNVKEKLRDN